jgi:4-hydroxybenzoate polyprenyltransferase
VIFVYVDVQPQVFLGLTINWGALMGWAAVQGSCQWDVVLPFYLSCACWTLVYDTIYAHMDKKDDEDAGILSTARFFGSSTKSALYGVIAVFGDDGLGGGE